MNKKIFIIVIVLLLTGCFNYKELNEYAIVTGMAIDYHNNEYEVSFLISSKDNSTSVISGKSNSIYGAIKDLSLSSSKELYINHLLVVIISEEYAKEGIDNMIDFLLREPQSNQNFYLAVAHNAKEILLVSSPLSNFSSEYIKDNITHTKELQGRIIDSSFITFMNKYLNDGSEPVLNSIKKINDQTISMDSIVLFKNDKIITKANEYQSVGIGLLLNQNDISYYKVDYDDTYVVVATNKTKIDYDINKDNVTINIKLYGSIKEVGNHTSIDNEKLIPLIEKEIKKYVDSSITLAKDNKTDIFGIGNMMYKKYPNCYKDIDDWNTFFKDIPINTNIKFILDNRGAIK